MYCRVAPFSDQGSVVRCLIPGATRSASSLRFASEDVPSADLTPGDVVAVVAGR